MALLSKEQILKADDLVYEIVEVPEWEGEVRLRTLTGSERDKFEADSIKVKGKKQELNFEDYRARLVALVVVDENGNQLFSGYDVGDLGRKSAIALDRVFEKAQEMNGMGEASAKEAVEDFENDQSSDSTDA